MDIKTAVRLLHNIIDSPADPTDAIESFLHAYWSEGNDALAKRNDVWREIRHLAFDLENYDSNPEMRRYGFPGAEQAVKKTQRALSLIDAELLTGHPQQVQGRRFM